MCGADHSGFSVASLIQTPQATGLFAAVFFWPMCSLWSLKTSGRSHGVSIACIAGIYASAAVFLVSPVTIFPDTNSAASAIFCALAALHYWLSLLPLVPQSGRETQRVRSSLYLGSSCFALLALLWIARLYGVAFVLEHLPYWLPFALEVVALGCLALVPAQTFEFTRTTTLARSNSLTYVQEHVGSLSGFFITLAMLAPTVYVWSLPYLAEVSLEHCPEEWASSWGCFFAHKCENYPHCGITGMAVSNFICTPQATGAMAAVFFSPLVHAWSIMERHHWDEKLWDFSTLMVFYLFFGAFLTCPINHWWTKPIHLAAVGTFCLAGLAHSKILLDRTGASGESRDRSLQVMFWLSTLGVFLVGVTKFVQLTLKFTTGSHFVSEQYPHLFWAEECLGLSAISIFPWLWHSRIAGTEPLGGPLLGTSA